MHYLKLTLFILLACCSGSVFGQDTPDSTKIIDAGAPSWFDHLYTEGYIDMTIETDLQQLQLEDRAEDWVPAKIQYELGGKEYTWDLKVKPRGRFRNRICPFPPLTLEFSKKDMAEQSLNAFDDWKLTTHCLEDAEVARELVLREYLVYRLLNVLTDYSFRVQLLRINWVDAQGKLPRQRRFGFLIEDIKELSGRLKGTAFEGFGLSPDKLNSRQEKLVSLFQFMIGNLDWSIQMYHNIRFLQPATDSSLLIIPYDFDFSGLVAAPYARKNTNVGQQSIRQRFFGGLAGTPEDLAPTITYYLEKRDELKKMVKDFKVLNALSRKDVLDYLDSFFEIIEKEGEVLKYKVERW